MALLLAVGAAEAGGQAGKRFFPSTLAVEDPFASDELGLDVIALPRPAPDGGGWQTSVAAEYAKRITPDLEISLGGAWLHVAPAGGGGESGFDNLEVGIKYQFFSSAPRETILSARLGLDIGGTGRRAVGADAFTTVEAAIGFARGLGDLPDGLRWARPFAVTGEIGAAMPTSAGSRPGGSNGTSGTGEQRNPNALRWGLVLQYSLPYLQASGQHPGLPAALQGLIPLVELDVTTALDRDEAGQTVATLNPGAIWVRRTFQVGLEAVIPLTARTGRGVGIRGGVSIYLDDLLPATIGRPLLGASPGD